MTRDFQWCATVDKIGFLVYFFFFMTSRKKCARSSWTVEFIRIDPIRFLILMKRVVWWHYFWRIQISVYFTLCMTSRKEMAGISLKVGLGRVVPVFLDPHCKNFPTMQLITKSRSNNWLCSVFSAWGNKIENNSFFILKTAYDSFIDS